MAAARFPLARFMDLCIDAHDAEAQKAFWSALLGLDIVPSDDGPAHLKAPDGGGLVVWVNEVPEPHTVKNRVHIDVHAASIDEVLALGATVVREPTAKDSWWQLADPDGGEFCAFLREELPPQRLYEIVVDAKDPVAQTQWWHAVLGGDLQVGDGPELAGALENVPGLAAEYLVFQSVPEPKTVKNRVHWDVTGDVDEVVRHGARVLAEPTESTPWHVLADPEGNEFCVFAPE